MASWSYEGEERCIADTGLVYWTIEPVVTKANLRFNDAGDGMDLVTADMANSDANAKLLIYPL